MASKFASRRNLDFLLYEVHAIERLFSLSYFEDHSRETCDLAIDTAMKLARNLLYPYLKEMDEREPVLEESQVKVHPIVKTMMKQWGEGGWLSSSLPFEVGGQQLPVAVHMACSHLFGAANFPATGYSGLTTGAAHLILSHGTDEMKDMYIPKMLAGQWQGTMAMTEPQAGSSLSDLTSRAVPTGQGYYKIRGQKIFISAGDHDGVENVVHMMLAKIEGAPAGVKGISLFLVPKKRPEANGSLEPNDVTATTVYHKLGYRGCPITQLSFGDSDSCRGYLVGEPHKGLSYMFQMMNEARLGVGMQAASIASAAYYASLEYASQRLQGRKLSSKDPCLPQVPIIEHADVRRMLFFQRAITEGSISLLLQCALYADLARAGDPVDRERYGLLLDLLTPVAKSYPSENGIISVSLGLQILGGYGYCREFPLEQYYRDIRIHSIHEGTTGIQGMDLLGRKVMMKNGKALELFAGEVQKAIKEAGAFEELKPYCGRLEAALEQCRAATMHRLKFAMKGELEKFLADATLYLELFGILAVAWQWLLQAVAACRGLRDDCSEKNRRFYNGKLHTMRYFFHYEAVKIQGLAARLLESDALMVEMDSTLFDD
ncbi:MAG: acyl-CoA dehydrogenase [Syntrophobacteraceae bacterium]